MASATYTRLTVSEHCSRHTCISASVHLCHGMEGQRLSAHACYRHVLAVYGMGFKCPWGCLACFPTLSMLCCMAPLAYMRTDAAFIVCVRAHVNAHFSAITASLRLLFGMPECHGICFTQAVAICQLHPVDDGVADTAVRQACVSVAQTLRHSFYAARRFHTLRRAPPKSPCFRLSFAPKIRSWLADSA